MSFSLALADGDLVQKGNQLDLVFGVDKLNQDVYLWLMERYGGDRFHVTMGSILQEFIGGIVGDSTLAEVESEVLRILQNYQAVQLRGIKENPQLYSTSELLVSIDDIQARLNFDTVNVTVRLRNGSGNTATIRVASSIQQ
ncbi:baseplate protein [Mycobacterium phage Phabba]|uniref:Baseplate wedge protein n=1 Tax=Mycobacterium phage Phabba TaxID=2027899 RepID=A0A249XSJ6_9CAUD|nr:baseplate protein [Mycobacterium phage Phabba]ASZ74709.1 baseplate wedge protein [Mycobacterium phage Phabba]